MDNDSKALNATVAAHYASDASGNLGYSLFDLSAVRKLDENDVSAQGTVRFMKAFSSSDDVGELELREANLSLSEPWIEVRVGPDGFVRYRQHHPLFRALSPNGFKAVGRNQGLYPLQVLFRGGGLQERFQPADFVKLLLFSNPSFGPGRGH